MGRHHLKLPDHLYLSPPSTQTNSAFSSASSFFSSKTPFSRDSTSSFYGSTYTSHAFGSKIPGFSTSAAFLTALRANIDLQIDSPDSPANTPDCLRPVALSSSVSSLPPPSPLVRATSVLDISMDNDLAPPSNLRSPDSMDTEPEEQVTAADSQELDAIPELRTFVADDESSRIAALRLVADSVAQQRQIASRALIFHPATAAILAVVVSLLYKYFYKGEFSDWALIGTTFAGVLMAVMVIIRASSGGYLEEAERVGTWKWLNRGREAGSEKDSGMKVLGSTDEIIVTKFGAEYIGAIIFRGVQLVDEVSGSTKKSRRSQSSSDQTKTEIRAWTVKQRYRGKEIGTALLEDAIKSSYEHGWASGGFEIATDHANSKAMLPAMFSGFVYKNNERARKHLDRKVREYSESNPTGKGGKKRR